AARNRRAASQRNPPPAPRICGARTKPADVGRLGRPGRQVPLGAVRRDAAAHLTLPCADPRAAAADARRAVRRTRCVHPRGIVVRDPRSACRAQDHRLPRDPRPARSRVPCRPRVRDVVAAGPHSGRAQDRHPSPARSRRGVHARLPGHRARAALTYREGAAMTRSDVMVRAAPWLEDVLKALGASTLDIMRKVGIPRTLPYFFGSLKIAITLAFVGSVISESIASNYGIGNLMLQAQAQFQVPLIFAGLVALAVEGIVMYAAMAALEARMTGWAHRSGFAPG